MCIDCTTSATQLWHAFNAKCAGCRARQISRGPDFWRCSKAGRQDSAYLALLRSLELTHEQVKTAAAADAMRGTA